MNNPDALKIFRHENGTKTQVSSLDLKVGDYFSIQNPDSTWVSNKQGCVILKVTDMTIQGNGPTFGTAWSTLPLKDEPSYTSLDNPLSKRNHHVT